MSDSNFLNLDDFSLLDARVRGTLLAVDLGVRTGLALYGHDGRLIWYRSKNFGNKTRLRRGARSVLDDLPNLAGVVLEGGGAIAEIWQREIERRGIAVRLISAETWRDALFFRREQRSSAIAKQTADMMARQVIEWSGAARPTSLRHDAAEAILIGLWGVLEIGWLAATPDELRR